MSDTGARTREWLGKQRDELINMSRRNRLLYFKHSKTASVEVVEPTPVGILDQLDRSGQLSFYLPPAEDSETSASTPAPVPEPNELVSADKDANQIGRALRLLERKANQEFLNKGLWVLYLGLGMMAWRESDDADKPAASPLLLLPVTVTRDSLRASFRLRRTEDDPVVNPALAVKLEGDFDLALPGVGSFEENGLDGFLREVEELAQGREGWSVTRRTVLSTFTFQKEGMYRDLLDNEEDLAANPMIQVLALGTEAPSAGSFDFEPVAEDHLEEAAPPEDLVSIRDADATQRRCVLAARDGHSFVMDGPPGSGKSQTITNIIAELMHAGKSVLFVSEKAAALEVVHNRLKDAHLDEFALQLHSHNATRKAVAAELGRSLRSRPTANGAFTAQQRADLERRRKALSSYAQAMNEVRDLGRSLHQVLGTVATLQSSPQAPVPTGFGRSLRAEELSAILETADRLGRAWDPVLRGDGFLWRDLKDATLSASRQSEVERDLAAAESALDSLHYLVMSIDEEFGLGWASGPADGRRLLDLLVLLNERMAVPSAWLSTETLDTLRQRSAELSEATRRFWAKDTELRDRAGAGADDLQARDAPDHNAAVAALRQARPPLDPDGDATADTLRNMVRFLRDSSDRLDTIAGDAGRVAAGFGLAEGGFSIDRAAELADLGALIDTPTRPEPQWLNPATQPALEEAHRVLGELHREFLERRDDLRDVFTDDVLELDLRSLRTRFAEVHRGLGKLRSAYREDTRTLAPYTVSGKVGRRVRERLGDAAAWQELADRLTTAESHHVDTLGTHYYQRGSADFDRIATAIQVARDAVRLAGGGAGEAFTRQLARGESPDPDLVLVARRLGTAVTSWLDEARRVLGPMADQLRGMPGGALRSWCENAAERLEVLNDTAEHVSGTIGEPVSLAFSRDALERVSNMERLRASVEGAFADDVSLFGDRFDGVHTDWTAVDHALAWAELVRTTALGGPVDPRAAEALAATDTSPDELRQRLTTWEKASARVTGQFTESRAESVAAELDGAFDGVRELLRALRDTVGDIEVWASYARATAWLANQGLEPVVGFCTEQRVAAEDVRPVIERAVLEAWADDVLRSDTERLGALRAADRDALVAEFRELDRQQVDSAAARVINACTARRPTSTAGAAGVIQREAEKKRRHMPVRELMGKTSGVVQTLKPCFMMSPLSVSQYLPPTMRFDVVIFDEASQVRPSDAVNCGYRGNQLIVAGDQQQLPPTSFFTAIGEAGDDTYDEEQIDEFESVLDLCKAGALRSLPLLWHYRSRHESLITYSNYNFYDGRLLTFPSATEEGPDVGIELIKVDGVYRRGSTKDNTVEAQKVIERVLHHRRHHPDLTLGVVTFSSAQEDAIERELELRSAGYPELAGLRTEDRIGGFFIKNLENVQGDERDVIIFSVGYGPDEHGKFTLRIPHLSWSKSERRLNVAITRAKSRVEIVTSVHAGDFPNTLGSNGLRHLKGYLDFAERGTSALAVATLEHGNEPESPFEEEVLAALRSWGYNAEPQVGVAGYRIDIGVTHPGNPGTFALGVECDGAMYHSSKVARDRDRLRQSVLEGLGWNIHRIWGTAWYRDRAGQEARLRAAVEEAAAGTFNERAAAAPAAESTVVVQREEANLDAEPQWTEPYRAADIDDVGTFFDMYEPEARDALRRVIARVVRSEGPVHEERVLRAVRTAWGVGRVSQRMRHAFDQAVRDLVHGGHLEREDHSFLSAPSSVLTTVRVPADEPDSRREVKHVPPRELRLAITRIVGEAHAITPEGVSVRVARLFGWQRRGTEVRAALDDAIKALTDSGELVLVGGRLEHAAN